MRTFVCSRSTDKLSVPHFFSLSLSFFYMFIFIFYLFFFSHVSRPSTRRWPHVAGAATLPLLLFPPSQARHAPLTLLASVKVSDNLSLPHIVPYITAHLCALVFSVFQLARYPDRGLTPWPDAKAKGSRGQQASRGHRPPWSSRLNESRSALISQAPFG